MASQPILERCCAKHKHSELRMHFVQLLAIWACNFATSGTLFSATAVLYPALKKHFGLSQYTISWLPALTMLSFGICALPGGYFVHTYGCVCAIRVGAVLISLSSLCYCMAGSIELLMVVHLLYGVGFSLCGLSTNIVFVTSWFKEQRATAITIMVTAFSVAGTLVSPLTAILVERYGWRHAYMFCPGMMLVVVIPLAFCVLREGHLLGKEACLEVESSREDDDQSCFISSDVPEPQDLALEGASSMTFWDSLRHRAVWHIALQSMYTVGVVISVLHVLSLYLHSDVKLSLELCGTYSSVLFLLNMVGKLAAGVAFDSPARRTAGIASYALLVAGLLLFFNPTTLGLSRSHQQLLVFAGVYGLGYGACFGIIVALPAKVFGRMPEFSKLQSFLMCFHTVGTVGGTLSATKLRMMTGSYAWSFRLFIAAAVLAGLHYAALEFYMQAQSGRPKSLAEHSQSSDSEEHQE